jgi:polysaccharide deacetylase family protein (PEP-CTERM system associated)
VLPCAHALSVDVEDWFHDGGLVMRAEIGHRVDMNTRSVLDVLAAAGARATFFFLGEVASRYPRLVRAVADAGHEIGSHGYQHRPLGQVLWREFRDDVARSLRVLEDVSGRAVRGFRAPYFSIKAGHRWPLDVLAELGVRYDSSVLPIDRPPGLTVVCPRTPFRQHNGLWEVPVAVLQVLSVWHLPLASGAGVRLVPPRLLLRWLRRFEREIGAAVFYLHPWELDPGAPRARGRWLLGIGRSQLVPRLRVLLRQRRFRSIADVFPHVAQ